MGAHWRDAQFDLVQIVAVFLSKSAVLSHGLWLAEVIAKGKKSAVEVYLAETEAPSSFQHFRNMFLLRSWAYRGGNDKNVAWTRKKWLNC